MSEEKHRAREEAIVRDVMTNGMNVDRRNLFVSAAAFGVTAAAVPALAQQPAPATAPAAAPAAPAAPARKAILKDDSRVLNIGATVRSGNYWNYSTYMTPVEEFYVRNHYPTPLVEQKPELARENWRLKIHGASVERPIEIGYEDLVKMPSRTIIATMECHGNGRTLFWEQGGFTGKEVAGGNWVLGAIGQAEWRYVPMAEIFARVGVKPNAKTVLFWSGVDGNDMGRPMPFADVLAQQNDLGICYAMNGNPLGPDHGSPVRAVVPGWGGTASIKWLTEIRVTDKRVWCRLNTKGEVYIGPDYQAPESAAEDEFIGVTAADIKGPMVTWMPPKSLITVPLVIEKSPSLPANYPLQKGEVPKLAAGKQTMRGYAWAPQHGVKHVEFRIDGGSWEMATLVPPNLGKYTWVRFEFPWDAKAGQHVIETRTTDNKGTTQPEQIPLNSLGMANWSIPKFRIEVA
ncbi:MAG: molybdopterin-dependent oxidoreductase [Hyphomicrobiaceae bacterium]|nr:molybdopterin-dependent oxidoreductase [Hyphomicrobiaceae bacterium]